MSVGAAIAAAINLEGLRPVDGWPDPVLTDAAIVEGPLTSEDNDLAGSRVAELWEITLLFSLGAGISRTRARLMEYLEPRGSKSIRQALYANPTLGGQVQAFLWRGLTTPPGRIQIFGKGLQAEIPIDEYYGTVIQLEVVS